MDSDADAAVFRRIWGRRLFVCGTKSYRGGMKMNLRKVCAFVLIAAFLFTGAGTGTAAEVLRMATTTSTDKARRYPEVLSARPAGGGVRA